MRRLPPELENKAPRINPKKFTAGKSARLQEISTTWQVGMLELHSNWNFVGWTLSADVAPREMCHYVIMCQRHDDGQQF